MVRLWFWRKFFEAKIGPHPGWNHVFHIVVSWWSQSSQPRGRRGWLTCTGKYSCRYAGVEGPGISSPGEREEGADLAVGPGLLGIRRVPAPLTRRFGRSNVWSRLRCSFILKSEFSSLRSSAQPWHADEYTSRVRFGTFDSPNQVFKKLDF